MPTIAGFLVSETEHIRAMTELKTDSALLRAERRDTVKLLIVLALVIISLIACMRWLPS
jgi:hypothetical protein